MNEIYFKNGSTIKILDIEDTIRGHRAKLLNPVTESSLSSEDMEYVHKVLTAFQNLGELNETQLDKIDQQIYVSSGGINKDG